MEKEFTRRDSLKATGAAGVALSGVRLAEAQDPVPPEQGRSAAGLRLPPSKSFGSASWVLERAGRGMSSSVA
ncbi:MAG: hypothetical protein KatS3mg015_0047 [Fimbriimonadales bacterium]|nr:MAG: hypothetical protein KatS3mg015_0047 [Fimbriimonadales bacterium]